MPGRMEFEFSSRAPGARPVSTDPLRILVMGDFSGRGPRDLAERRPLAVDVDNFDEVFAKLAPRAVLPTGEVEFGELDDFHPDALYRNYEIFAELRKMRKRLLDPATFVQAAAELRQDAASIERKPASPEEPVPEAEDATLERLLGRPSERGVENPPVRVAGKGLDEMIRGLVAPFIVPDRDPNQDLYVSSVDAAITEQMRAVLRDPGFAEREAAWRGLHGLVTGVETGEELFIHVLDCTRDEIAADVAATGANLGASALYRILVERVPGDRPWSLLVTDFAFGASEADLALLGALGAVAAHGGSALLGTAAPSLLGIASVPATPGPEHWGEPVEAWNHLRRSPWAASIGLALPRVLARLPYGKRTDEIDSFEFEEVAGDPAPDAFLWGNPSFVCARLIALAFTQRGWSFSPGDVQDFGDLPSFVYKDSDGESQQWPCAEVYLPERTGGEILARGIMPVLSNRSRNAVHIYRFQSIADPAKPLAGPWA